MKHKCLAITRQHYEIALAPSSTKLDPQTLKSCAKIGLSMNAFVCGKLPLSHPHVGKVTKMWNDAMILTPTLRQSQRGGSMHSNLKNINYILSLGLIQMTYFKNPKP